MNTVREVGELAGSVEREPENFFRKFFNVGGSIFYCLSALSIIWGLSQVVIPIFKQSELMREKVFCIGALNLYEILLIGILLVLILWKKVKDDAVSLVVILALFFAVGGIMIGAIANDNVFLAAILGLLSLVLAGGKLFAIRKYAAVNIGPCLIVGTALVLAWNFLISTVMAHFHIEDTGMSEAVIWRSGWLVMLAGAFAMLLQGLFTSQGDKTVGGAFINSIGMGWIFALEILITGLVHQYVISYIFDLPILFGDFLPILVLMTFMLLELLRIKEKEGILDSFISLIPLVTVILTSALGGMPEVTGPSMLVWSSGGIFALCGAWLMLLGILRNQQRYFFYASPYLLAIVIIGISTSPDSITVTDVHWKIPLVLLAVAVMAFGIISRKPVLLFICAICGTIALLSMSEVEIFLSEHYLSQTSAAGLLMGTGVLFIYNYFKDDIPFYFGVIGAGLFAMGTLNFGGDVLAFRMFLSAIFIVAASALTWWKLHSKILIMILATPLLWFLYLNLKILHGWNYILLSFILLIVGGLVSIRKGEKQQKAISLT